MIASKPSIRALRVHAGLSLVALAGVLGGCQAFDKPDPKAAPPSRPTTVIDSSKEGRPPAVTVDDPGRVPGATATTGVRDLYKPPTPPDAAAPAVQPTAEAAVAQGEQLASEGRYAEALQAFDRAIADNPLLISAYVGSADVLRMQGDYVAAEARYAKACEIEPSNFDAQYGHALTLQMLNRWPDAIGAYLRALAIKPEDFQSNMAVASAYLQLTEPAQALPFAQRAAASDPNSGPARNTLGRIYAAMDRHAEAIVEYQQAAELMPLTAPLLLNLANSLGKENRHEQAVNVLNQLIQTEPTPAAYERLGASLFKLRRYDAAMAAFRTALEIDPNHFPALNGLGVCLLNQFEFTGQNDDTARREAIRALRRSLQLQPNQPVILNLVTRYQ